MKIEIDTVIEVLTVDGEKISLHLLKCLTTEDKLWFRIQRDENGLIVVTKPVEQP